MDWVTALESAEAKQELERREAEAKAEEEEKAKEPPKPQVELKGKEPPKPREELKGKEPSKLREPRRDGPRSDPAKGREPRRDGPRSTRDDARGHGRGGRDRRPAGKQSSNAVLLMGIPNEWKEVDVKRFFMSVVKDTIEESQIGHIRTFTPRGTNALHQAVVEFNSPEAFQKGLKAHNTTVQGKEVRITEYLKNPHSRSDAGGRPPYRRPRPAPAAAGSEPAAAKENPFGGAHPTDTPMKLERQQIEKEQKVTTGEGEAASSTEAAAKPSTEEGAAAPEAQTETKPEGTPEDKPEAKPEAKGAAPVRSSGRNGRSPNYRKGVNKGPAGKTPAKAAAAKKPEPKSEETKKALARQQKEREKKKAAEAEEKRRKDKTFNRYDALGGDD